VNKVGKDGMVTVDEGKGLETVVDYTEGLEFDRGWASPYFVTNEQRMEAVIHNPAILIVNAKLSLVNETLPLLEQVAKITKDIVLICIDISGDALTTLVANKKKGNINTVAVKAPGNGDDRINYLEDIATVVGGKVVDPTKSMDLTQPESYVGKAKKVVSGRDSTVIIEGEGAKKEIEERMSNLKAQISEETSQFEKEKKEERLAKLSTGVAVIRVGAKTELDMREKVERVKDAVGAATAARDEGVVAGGGTAFLRLKTALTGDTEGEKLLLDILEAPIRKLLANSGETSDKANSVIKVVEQADSNQGYNVNTGEIVDLDKSGIIDPKKVIRLAIENAIGVGTSILTTDCLISIRKKDVKN
jgi:chaperonin GroEL